VTGVFFQQNLNAMRRRMARDVGQSFLKNAKSGDGLLVV